MRVGDRGTIPVDRQMRSNAASIFAIGDVVGQPMLVHKALREGRVAAEATPAIGMGADAADIGLTVHPHSTLPETFGMAAEALEGTITDLYMPKKK
jgi:pyruvate/2-oxoglutarate dehydrogenase complex dihydrolipoamide dehydrogenase (E3) component